MGFIVKKGVARGVWSNRWNYSYHHSFQRTERLGGLPLRGVELKVLRPATKS